MIKEFWNVKKKIKTTYKKNGLVNLCHIFITEGRKYDFI